MKRIPGKIPNGFREVGEREALCLLDRWAFAGPHDEHWTEITRYTVGFFPTDFNDRTYIRPTTTEKQDDNERKS